MPWLLFPTMWLGHQSTSVCYQHYDFCVHQRCVCNDLTHPGNHPRKNRFYQRAYCFTQHLERGHRCKPQPTTIQDPDATALGRSRTMDILRPRRFKVWTPDPRIRVQGRVWVILHRSRSTFPPGRRRGKMGEDGSTVTRATVWRKRGRDWIGEMPSTKRAIISSYLHLHSSAKTLVGV